MRIGKKLMAMFFSTVPGAGHMYLGLQKQGLQFMSIFFFIIFLTSWIHVELLMFLIPIIWFYNFFDILNIASGNKMAKDEDIIFLSWLGKDNGWFKEKNKIAGYVLVVLGLVLIAEKIVLPRISWEYRNIFETGTVAIIFILGGVRLLMGSKAVNNIRLEEDKQ